MIVFSTIYQKIVFLTEQDLQNILYNNSEYLVLVPDFYVSCEVLDKNHNSILFNEFSIYQNYAVTGNDSSYWYKINEELYNYITMLNLEICNRMLDEEIL